mmetsp:Transcript_40902/g.96248  ORF Transcript_40902/g.96248 Transcript_40902/m.96248 type:complete len:606 (-) Transcript_40902:439-2256(-)
MSSFISTATPPPTQAVLRIVNAMGASPSSAHAMSGSRALSSFSRRSRLPKVPSASSSHRAATKAYWRASAIAAQRPRSLASAPPRAPRASTAPSCALLSVAAICSGGRQHTAAQCWTYTILEITFTSTASAPDRPRSGRSNFSTSRTSESQQMPRTRSAVRTISWGTAPGASVHAVLCEGPRHGAMAAELAELRTLKISLEAEGTRLVKAYGSSAATIVELSSKLDAASAQLVATSEHLGSTQSELVSTQSQLGSTQSQLTAAQETVATAKADAQAAAAAELLAVRTQLGTETAVHQAASAEREARLGRMAGALESCRRELSLTAGAEREAQAATALAERARAAMASTVQSLAEEASSASAAAEAYRNGSAVPALEQAHAVSMASVLSDSAAKQAESSSALSDARAALAASNSERSLVAAACARSAQRAEAAEVAAAAVGARAVASEQALGGCEAARESEKARLEQAVTNCVSTTPPSRRVPRRPRRCSSCARVATSARRPSPQSWRGRRRRSPRSSSRPRPRGRRKARRRTRACSLCACRSGARGLRERCRFALCTARGTRALGGLTRAGEGRLRSTRRGRRGAPRRRQRRWRWRRQLLWRLRW